MYHNNYNKRLDVQCVFCTLQFCALDCDWYLGRRSDSISRFMLCLVLHAVAGLRSDYAQHTFVVQIVN